MAGADVFVFPSRTDTFGIVMLESMACGVPIAAFPVQGPLDVVQAGRTGVLHEDLARAIRGALEIDPARCRVFAEQHTWERCTRQFIGHLASAVPGDKLRLSLEGNGTVACRVASRFSP